MRTLTSTLLAALVLLAGRLTAAELGQPQADLLAKHGPPQTVDARGFACYRWDAWTLAIQFADGAAARLEYAKAASLTEPDVLGVLTANGGQTAWTKTADRAWIRRDGAAATLSADGLTLTLSAARRPAPPVAAEATPARIAPPKPFQFTAQPPAPVRAKPEPPKSHFWLMLFSWVPPLLLAAFGKYLQKRQGLPKVFGPSDVIYPTPTIGPGGPPPATMDSVSWTQFELVIAEVFRRLDYAVEVAAGLGADGGIDVKLTKPGELVLVQCKQWKVFKVNVKEVRAFYGVMVSEGATRGVFVSSGEYTRDCRAFAEGKPLELLGRGEIARLVQSVQLPGENLWAVQTWLPAFKAAAKITTPTCPFCQAVMTLRQAKGKPPFWGCPKYPRCRGKREARLELLGG